jgi:hypothetical protein
MAIDLQTAFATVVHTDDGATFAQLQTAFASVVHTDDGTTFAQLQMAFASVVHGDDEVTFAQLQTAFSSVVSEQPLTVAIVSNTPATATIANPFTFIGSNSIADTWEWSFTSVPAGSAIPVGEIALPDGGATTPIDMTDNEVLYHFDGTGSDTSGNANPIGTFFGTAYNTGLISGTQAIEFTATNSYVLLTTPISLAGDFTITFWAYNLGGDGTTRTSTMDSGGSPYDIPIRVNASNQLVTNTSNIDRSSGFVLAAADYQGWHHFVAVGDSVAGTTTFYVDGQQAGSVVAFKVSSDLEAIGNAAPFSQRFAERITEFALFSRKVSVAEIQQFYDYPQGIYARTEDLTFIPDVTGVYDVTLNVFGADEGESQTDSTTGEVTGNLGMAEYPIGQFASRKTDLIGRFAFPFIPKIEE